MILNSRKINFQIVFFLENIDFLGLFQNLREIFSETIKNKEKFDLSKYYPSDIEFEIKITEFAIKLLKFYSKNMPDKKIDVKSLENPKNSRHFNSVFFFSKIKKIVNISYRK